MADDSNVRSIQGEQQGELLPHRRLKLNGHSLNELKKPVPYGGQVTLIVTGTVTAEGRERRKDGVNIMTSTITVDQCEIQSVEEPEDDQGSFDELMHG